MSNTFKRIIEQAVTPALRRNDFAGGIEAGIDQIMARVSGENLPLPEAGSAPEDAGLGVTISTPRSSPLLRLRTTN